MVIESLVPSAPARPGARAVRIGDAVFGTDRVPVIAGPCAVEPGYVDHAMVTAEAGAAVLRGCVFKPRTSPHTFQGLGENGLMLLDEARGRTGAPVIAEPLEPSHVAALAGHADALLIGARSMHNTPLLRAAGRSGLPVVVKRGMSATYDEWIAAADYVLAEGNEAVMLCERGIRTFETATRNTLDLSAIVVLRERTGLPVIVDPSHAAGRAAWVPALAIAAVAAGADGLLIESHPHPERSMCDAAQAVTPLQLREIVRAVARLGALVRPTDPADLEDARNQLDAVDSALACLLDRRARLVAAAARVKQRDGLPERDRRREHEVVARVQREAPALGDPGAARVMRTVIDACLAALDGAGDTEGTLAAASAT